MRGTFEKNGAVDAGGGSCRSDLSGSSCGGGDPACENMRVNAPGSDVVGALGNCGAAADSREPDACEAWNIRVNSPGPEAGAEGGASAMGGVGAGAGESTGYCAIAGAKSDAVLALADGTLAGLSPIAPNTCVKLPGEEGDGALAGCGGAGVNEAGDGLGDEFGWPNSLRISTDAGCCAAAFLSSER